MTVTQLELYHDPSHLVTIPPILLQPPAAEAVATVFTHSPSWPLTKAQLTNVSGFLVIYCDLWAMAAFSRSDHSGLLNCSLHRVRNSMLNPWRGSTCRPPGASLRSTDITDFWEKRGLPSKVVLLFCCILDKSIQRMSESHTNDISDTWDPYFILSKKSQVNQVRLCFMRQTLRSLKDV